VNTRRRFRWIWASVALLAIAGGVHVGSRGLERHLEKKARELDLSAALQGTGLPGKVFSFTWTKTRLRWLPRPALELQDVQIRLLSGQPGPGAASGTLTLARLHAVPGWDFLRTRRLDRVESSGGSMEVGSDLLPRLPREYFDPVDNALRPVPWEALLAVAADSTGRSIPRVRKGVARPPLPRQERGDFPSVILRNLQVRVPAFEALPVADITLDHARIVLSPERVEVVGKLRGLDTSGHRLTVPFELHRDPLAAEKEPGWTARLGRPGSGFLVEVVTPRRGIPANWAVEFMDPVGHLGAALLANRDGALRALTWSGPWRLRSSGSGAFPRGLEQTDIQLLDGELLVEGSQPPCKAITTGSMRILPGRVDLQRLRLAFGEEPDTLGLRFTWLRTVQGKRISGRLQGALDPAWIALAGRGWSASGQLRAGLDFSGSFDEVTRDWQLQPYGRLEGTLDSLVSPWLADTLRQGELKSWPEGGKQKILWTGRWGRSPIRLQFDGLPPLSPRFAENAQGSRWSVRSPYVRVEDFRINRNEFPSAGPLPFWLALPGAGQIELAGGSIFGIPFDSLRARTYRSTESARLEELDVRIGPGRLRAVPLPGWPRPAGALVRDAFAVRLTGEDLEVADVQQMLRAAGHRFPGVLRGRLGGSLEVRIPEPLVEVRRIPSISGNLHARNGSIREIPMLDALAVETGLEQLSILAFRDWRMEVTYGEDGLAWNRMRVEMPPVCLEGAGRVLSSSRIQAVLLMRANTGGSSSAGAGRGGPVAGGASSSLAEPLEAGGSGQLLSDLATLLGGSGSSLYAVVEGTWQVPSLHLVPRSTFLKELERLGASLPI